MTEVADLKIYTNAEIDLFLAGDRRDVDRLMLQGINTIAAVLIPHIRKEDGVMEALGDVDTIRTRTVWIENQIAKQVKRNAMMDKVASSAVTWAVIAFLAFLLVVAKDEIILFVKAHAAGAK